MQSLRKLPTTRLFVAELGHPTRPGTTVVMPALGSVAMKFCKRGVALANQGDEREDPATSSAVDLRKYAKGIAAQGRRLLQALRGLLGVVRRGKILAQAATRFIAGGSARASGELTMPPWLYTSSEFQALALGERGPAHRLRSYSSEDSGFFKFIRPS